MQAGPEHGGSDASSDAGSAAILHIVIPAKAPTDVIPAKAGIHLDLEAKLALAFAATTIVAGHHHADPHQARD
jgi:hypothetical protein